MRERLRGIQTLPLPRTPTIDALHACLGRRRRLWWIRVRLVTAFVRLDLTGIMTKLSVSPPAFEQYVERRAIIVWCRGRGRPSSLDWPMLGEDV